MWPKGKVFSFSIPTLFVDYHPANDMFFSGHTGISLLIGLELLELEYFKLAWFQLFLVFPFISVWVVALRVHRGIDVIAAIFAAIAACGISKTISESVDLQLQIHRKNKNKKD